MTNLIAAILPLPRKLREPEHDRPSHVLLAPGFLQGDAGTCGLGSVICAGSQVTAGKCFSFRTLVHDANQSASRIFEAFSLSPVHAEPLFLGLVALSDGHRVGERKSHVRHEAGQIRPETGQ